MKKLMLLGLIAGMGAGTYAMEAPEKLGLEEYKEAEDYPMESKAEIISTLEQMDDVEIIALTMRLEEEGIIKEAPKSRVKDTTIEAINSMNTDTLHSLLGIAQAKGVYQNNLRGFNPGSDPTRTLGGSPVFTRTTTAATKLNYEKFTGDNRHDEYDLTYVIADGYVSLTPNWGVGFVAEKVDSHVDHDNNKDSFAFSVTPRYDTNKYTLVENLNIFGFEAPVRTKFGMEVDFDFGTTQEQNVAPSRSGNDTVGFRPDVTLSYGNHDFNFGWKSIVNFNSGQVNYEFEPVYKYVINDLMAAGISYFHFSGEGTDNSEWSPYYQFTFRNGAFLEFSMDIGKDYDDSRREYVSGTAYGEYPIGLHLFKEGSALRDLFAVAEVSTSYNNVKGGVEEDYDTYFISGGLKWTI